jgi:hypothetical protein
MRGVDGMLHVDYDLLITNWLPVTVILDRVKAVDPQGNVVFELTGDALSAQTHVINSATPTREIPAGSSVATGMDVALPAGDGLPEQDIPSKLSHTIHYSLASDIGLGDAQRVSESVGGEIDGPTTPVVTSAPPVIAPPLHGQFLNFNGCCDGSSRHRQLLYPDENGNWVKSETWAIDWAGFRDGGLFAGDGSTNAQWYGFGATVTAATPGRVVRAVDGRPDIAPCGRGCTNPTPPILNTPDDIGGNYVLIDMGNGQFAYYAHLKEGSVAVRAGQRVRVGDTLGALGNSGNTTAPHLHFGLQDGPAALSAESLPWVFDQFTFVGTFDPSTDAVIGPPAPAFKAYPLLNSVVDLP